ncbi:unnamed protein product [Gadus morhua 'NCC']
MKWQQALPCGLPVGSTHPHPPLPHPYLLGRGLTAQHQQLERLSISHLPDWGQLSETESREARTNTGKCLNAPFSGEDLNDRTQSPAHTRQRTGGSLKTS